MGAKASAGRVDRRLLAMWGATLVAALEMVAIARGIDGAVLSLAFSVIGGLCGWSIRGRRR